LTLIKITFGNGLLCGIDINLYDVGSFKDGKYMLQLNLWDKTNKIKWNFINVYGAAQEENKNEFLAEFASFCNNMSEPYLIGGDFNIIRCASEKNKGGGVHRHAQLFNSIINSLDLLEIHMNGGRFTWSNNQSNPTLERLDRCLMSKSWEDIFPRIMMYKLPREVSDHNPLILTDNTTQPLNNLTFKFELSWLRHPDFTPLV
jgi:hypothetical protein